MIAVQQKGKSVSAAAKEHCVPRKTLYDWIKGRVAHGRDLGLFTVFYAQKEDALASYLLYMAEHDSPLTSNMACGFAWAVSL